MAASGTGGTWSNAEDQVLLAACAKYGIGTSWPRISSLLPRKSPKQCKARFQNYLDPTLKKIEWSREEDEQLLHLSKVFGGQWATVATQIPGRTQYMLQERYNKLLDEEHEREVKAGAGDDILPAEAAAPTGEDVRRLRPGEVDYFAESRPARPDAVDMDEVDLEMLQEARARMVNVSGKKAKRKARERQLDLSKRLALLQKRRELKMSGINIKIKTTKKGEMDYNADIPFERAPVPGFHDTIEEIERNERQREAFDPRKQQLAIKRKGDPQDNEEMSRKKRKDDKTDRQSLSTAAIKAAQMQKVREAEQSSKRRALILPAPEVGDAELEDIVKVGLSGRGAIEAAVASDTPATRGLISDYSRMTGATPLRTPLRTPGPMSTPFRQSLQVGRASAVGGYEPESHLNEKLTALPAPRETEWELELPEGQEEVMDVDTRPEDAEVRDARLKAMQEAAEKEEFQRQTQVVQRRLPRPVVVDVNALVKVAKSITDPIRKAVAEEAALLIANDAISFGGAKVTGTVKPLPFIEPADISKARQMVVLELSSDESSQEQEKIANALDELHNKSKLPGLDDYDDEIDEHQLMVEEFDNMQEKIMKAAEKGNELEKKLAKYQGGYLARSKLLRQKISEAANALEQVSIEVNTAKSAQIVEQAAAERRLQKLLDEVAFVKKRELEAQDAYRAAKEELDSLEMVNGRH